jgi:hypothetical protein
LQHLDAEKKAAYVEGGELTAGLLLLAMGEFV